MNELELVYFHPTSTDITAMTRFFAEQMQFTLEKGYTQEDIDWNISEYHTENHFKKYILDTYIYLEIVKYGGEIIGYIEARESQKDNSRIHIWWVLVDKKFQGRGIAKKLYDTLQEWMRQSGYIKLTASTKKENSVSVQFHTSQGFSKTKETHDDFEFEKTL